MVYGNHRAFRFEYNAAADARLWEGMRRFRFEIFGKLLSPHCEESHERERRSPRTCGRGEPRLRMGAARPPRGETGRPGGRMVALWRYYRMLTAD
jgi:hypothetical protein